MQFNFPPCAGCAHRRELMAKWVQAWREWAVKPLGPHPGSPQWLAQHPEFRDVPKEADDQ